VSANVNYSNRIILYSALLALLALGLWLRLRFIHTVQLYPDEFVTLLAVQRIGEKGAPVMPSGLFYDHGLLFSYVGSLVAGFGPAHLAVRYISLLFGMLTLGLTFWLGQRWFSPAVGLIATTGLAIAPATIEWSSRARMYALLQLLVLVTLWLAYEGIVQNKAGWRWAALGAYLGATLTHFVAVTLAPPLVVGAIAVWWQKTKAGEQPLREASPGSRGAGDASQSPLLPHSFAPLLWEKGWRVWLEAVGLLLILILAFLVKRAGQPRGIEALDAASALPGLTQVLAIYGDFSLNLIDGWQAIAPFYLTLPALIFTPFAILVVVISLTPLFTASPPASRRLLAPLPSLFLAIILLLTTLEMILFVSPDRRDDKYLFMLQPILLLLGAQGIEMVWGLIVNSQLPTGGLRLSIVNSQRSIINPQGAFGSGQRSSLPSIIYHLSAIFYLLVSGLILTFTQPAIRTLLANTGDDYDSAFVYVQDHWQLGDKILTGTPAAAAFYLGHNDFYGVQRRGGYDYRLLTVGGQVVDRWLASPAIRTEAELHETLANHKVWLVLERWGLQREYYDLSFLQQLLAQTDYVSQAQGIFVLRSKTDPQPLRLDPAYPLEATFGNLVRLTGYTVEPEQSTSPRPEPDKGKQLLRLTLYWQALAPIPHDYTVFVHLRQPGGGTVAQADHRPLDNLYPTSLWPVGETIRESIFLPANLPPGDYELWIGLYLQETDERLPVQNDTSGENAVRLGELRIE
jgi:uncharacterized membrane protein